MGKVQISVILPVYNGEKYLKEAIQSILKQTFKNFELIIVDDGSTDNSLKIIHEFKDPRIIIINQKNLGLSQTLNKGINKAKSLIIARMDQDDISVPDRLKTQYKLFQRNYYSLIGTWYQDINDKGKGIKKVCRIIHNNDLKKALLVDNYFCHGSLMFKKISWKEVGGYNPEFDYAEDYDFISRIAENIENKLANIPKILYLHRINPQGMSISKRKNQQIKRLKISKRNFDINSNFYHKHYKITKYKSICLSQKNLAKRLAKELFIRGNLNFLYELVNVIL